jgi:hypothetical protein
MLGLSFFVGAEHANASSASLSITIWMAGVLSSLGSKMSMTFPSTNFLKACSIRDEFSIHKEETTTCLPWQVNKIMTQPNNHQFCDWQWRWVTLPRFTTFIIMKGNYMAWRAGNTHPSHCDTLITWSLQLNRSSASKHLYKENAKRVDIALLIQLISGQVFRIKISCCPFHLRGDVSGPLICWSRPRKPKIGDLSSTSIRKENIWSLYISMYNGAICANSRLLITQRWPAWIKHYNILQSENPLVPDYVHSKNRSWSKLTFSTSKPLKLKQGIPTISFRKVRQSGS